LRPLCYGFPQNENPSLSRHTSVTVYLRTNTDILKIQTLLPEIFISAFNFIFNLLIQIPVLFSWWNMIYTHQQHSLLYILSIVFEIYKTELNSVAWVCERTILTERPPLVGKVSGNFCGQRVPRGQRDGSLQPYSRLSRPEPLLFLPSSFSVVLTRLSGPRSRPTTSQIIW
jgi:hypothetical protein